MNPMTKIIPQVFARILTEEGGARRRLLANDLVVPTKVKFDVTGLPLVATLRNIARVSLNSKVQKKQRHTQNKKY
jgi:hypothetical protein